MANEQIRIMMHFVNARLFNRRRRRYQGDSPVTVLVPFDDCLFLDCDPFQAEFENRVHVSTPRCSFAIGGWTVDKIACKVETAVTLNDTRETEFGEGGRRAGFPMIRVWIQGEDLEVTKEGRLGNEGQPKAEADS